MTYTAAQVLQDYTNVYRDFVRAECQFDSVELHYRRNATPLSGQNFSQSQILAVLDEHRENPLPKFVKTGPNACSVPDTLKYFKGVRFFGDGHVWCRVLVDNKVVTQTPEANPVVMEEDPYKVRIMPIPRGTSGYWIDIEIVVVGKLLFFELDWDPVSGENEAASEETRR